MFSIVTIKGSIFGGPSATAYAGPASSKSSAGEPSELHIPFQDLSNNSDIFSLISWHGEVSQFVGREKELEELENWTFEDRNVSIKFITGKGGTGKSRLAAEFAKIMKKKGWNAGFIDLRKAQRFVINKKGTLLIVDYPEENIDETIEFFRDLARTMTDKKLRILFITRQSIDDWKAIIHDGKAMPIVDHAPVIVKQLNSSNEAHQIFDSTQKYAAKVFNTTPLGLSEDSFKAWLNLAPENQVVLFIVALGVHSALYPDEQSIRYNGHELVEALVEREKYRIRSIAKTRGLKENTFLILLAIGIIADKIPIARVLEIIQRPCFQKIFPDTNKIEAGFEASGILNNKCIIPLKPDIVAASFLITILGEEPDFAPDLIWTGLIDDPESGIPRLSRLIYDAEVILGMQKHGKLSTWFAKSLENNLERCNKVYAVLNNTLSSYCLLEASIAASKTIIKNETNEVRIAHLSNNISVDLIYLLI